MGETSSPVRPGSDAQAMPAALASRDVPSESDDLERTAAVSSDLLVSAEGTAAADVEIGAKTEPAVGGPAVGDDRTVISSEPPAQFSRSGTQSSAELGRLLIGEQLDHFLLEEYVGGGGMGAVFRATDSLLGRTVAVKVLSRQHAVDEETTRRFRNEAQSAARLDHQNIARVYFVGVDRGWHYIVLEYIEGQNVRDLVAQHGPMPFPNVLDISIQVAEALQHAAGRDVVHRDVKPSNVLVTADGHVKLVDMGLARLRQVEQSVEDITATGVTLGTFDYISPEQARDPRSADVRSDLYSLGCTIYYMLCGRPPFPEGTVLQKLLQHQGDEAPDCRQLRADTPECLVAIVRKLLAKNPLDRYQQPAELIGELILASEELGIELSQRRTAIFLPATADSGPWTQRHLPWMAPVALLILAVVGIQFWGRSNPLPPPPAIRADTLAAAPAPPGAATVPPQNSDRTARNPQRSGQPQDHVPDPLRDAQSTPPAPPAHVAPIVPNSEPKSGDRPAGGQKPPDSQTANPLAVPAVEPEATSAIVAVTAGKKQSYSTLAEACREAPTGSVIELWYSGRREEQPLSVANRELTIRAAEGFQPIVTFRPSASDPSLAPGGMLSVSGGDLTLVNVELELQMPQELRSEPWVLIEAMMMEKLRLERCTLTVSGSASLRGMNSQQAHFIVVNSPPYRNPEIMPDGMGAENPASIELRNCIVRGDANILSGNALHTVSLQWENGLLVTSESLLDLHASDEALPPTAQLQIDLQHITARMGRGMCRIATREGEKFLPLVKINCTDCILMTEGAPLIDQLGDEPVEDQLKVLLWKGNRNFYEGIDVFWRLDGPRTAGPTQLKWTAWRDHWGTGREMVDRGSSVAFVNFPGAQHPKAAQTPADYWLDASGLYNPAIGSATDGTANVGQKAELLPSTSLPSTKRSAAPTSGSPKAPPKTPPPFSPARPTEPADE